MRAFKISIDIQAPPARVLAVMGDVERWHEWTSTVTSIRLLDPGPMHVGSRMLIRQPKLPPATWKLTAIEAGRGFTSTTVGLGVIVRAHHYVDPAPAGSRATLSLYFGGPLGSLVGWLTRGLNQRYLGLEAAGLKRRSEET